MRRYSFGEWVSAAVGAFAVLFFLFYMASSAGGPLP